jgi:hypothetical protein
MERTSYIERALKDHLLDRTTYTRLSPDDVRKSDKATEAELKALLTSYESILPEHEMVYFKRYLQQDHRQKQFYITLKVHKKPMSSRPIVSCCGSLTEGFSKWLDAKMKLLIPFLPTHLRDSNQVLAELKKIGPLPRHAKLFTADAVSMYTNINTKHLLEVFRKWFDKLSDRLPSDFPVSFFLRVLEIVMTGNIFQFGDCFFRQEDGAAMGTSCAVLSAALYYGRHEIDTLIPQFHECFLYFKRFVDDMFGVWIGNERDWERFVSSLPFGLLTWTTDGLQDSATFLDLTLEIVDDRIVTKTFEKALNLFLYIPPSSAHSPGVLKSTIFGNVRRYWNQNSNKKDYQDAVRRFVARLEARGHDHDELRPLFQDAFEAIARNPTLPASSSSSTTSRHNAAVPQNTLFYHSEFHPRGVARRDIRHAYSETLEGHSGFDRFIIAYSRPRNIRDALMSSKLKEQVGLHVSDLIKTLPE